MGITNTTDTSDTTDTFMAKCSFRGPSFKASSGVAQNILSQVQASLTPRLVPLLSAVMETNKQTDEISRNFCALTEAAAPHHFLRSFASVTPAGAQPGRLENWSEVTLVDCREQLFIPDFVKVVGCFHD